MTFEQELYTNFNINTSRSYFITFPGDVSGVFSHASLTRPGVALTHDDTQQGFSCIIKFTCAADTLCTLGRGWPG